MCALNPKRELHFSLAVYTALDMPVDEFRQLVFLKLLEAENRLNTDMRLRWHVELQT